MGALSFRGGLTYHNEFGEELVDDGHERKNKNRREPKYQTLTAQSLFLNINLSVKVYYYGLIRRFRNIHQNICVIRPSQNLFWRDNALAFCALDLRFSGGWKEKEFKDEQSVGSRSDCQRDSWSFDRCYQQAVLTRLHGLSMWPSFPDSNGG